MKSKSVFYCTSCGNETPRWQGQCPACGAWNTITEYEETKVPGKRLSSTGYVPRKAKPLRAVESGEEIRIPSLGCSGIRNFRILCDVYAGNVEKPNWAGFLSEFRRITGCDGYVARDFVVCFDVDKIAIVGRF